MQSQNFKKAQPKRHGREKSVKHQPLPVVIESLSGLHASSNLWPVYSGVFTGNTVVVPHLEDAKALHQMGCFGRPVTSKFNTSPPTILRRRQYELRQKWAAADKSNRTRTVLDLSSSDDSSSDNDSDISVPRRPQQNRKTVIQTRNNPFTSTRQRRHQRAWYLEKDAWISSAFLDHPPPSPEVEQPSKRSRMDNEVSDEEITILSDSDDAPVQSVHSEDSGVLSTPASLEKENRNPNLSQSSASKALVLTTALGKSLRKSLEGRPQEIEVVDVDAQDVDEVQIVYDDPIAIGSPSWSNKDVEEIIYEPQPVDRGDTDIIELDSEKPSQVSSIHYLDDAVANEVVDHVESSDYPTSSQSDVAEIILVDGGVESRPVLENSTESSKNDQNCSQSDVAEISLADDEAESRPVSGTSIESSKNNQNCSQSDVAEISLAEVEAESRLVSESSTESSKNDQNCSQSDIAEISLADDEAESQLVSESSTENSKNDQNCSQSDIAEISLADDEAESRLASESSKDEETVEVLVEGGETVPITQKGDVEKAPDEISEKSLEVTSESSTSNPMVPENQTSSSVCCDGPATSGDNDSSSTCAINTVPSSLQDDDEDFSLHMSDSDSEEAPQNEPSKQSPEKQVSENDREILKESHNEPEGLATNPDGNTLQTDHNSTSKSPTDEKSTSGTHQVNEVAAEQDSNEAMEVDSPQDPDENIGAKNLDGKCSSPEKTAEVFSTETTQLEECDSQNEIEGKENQDDGDKTEMTNPLTDRQSTDEIEGPGKNGEVDDEDIELHYNGSDSDESANNMDCETEETQSAPSTAEHSEKATPIVPVPESKDEEPVEDVRMDYQGRSRGGVVVISDSDCDGDREELLKKWKPQLKPETYKCCDESITLGLEEAFFLHWALGCLQISTAEENLSSLMSVPAETPSQNIPPRRESQGDIEVVTLDVEDGAPRCNSPQPGPSGLQNSNKVANTYDLKPVDGEKGSFYLIPSVSWQLFCNLQHSFASRYVAYHYFRSLGWVVKSGLKFGGDFLLYEKGPSHTHASYVVVVAQHNESMTWERIVTLNRISEVTKKELLLCNLEWPTGPRSLENLSKVRVWERLAKRVKLVQKPDRGGANLSSDEDPGSEDSQ